MILHTLCYSIIPRKSRIGFFKRFRGTICAGARRRAPTSNGQQPRLSAFLAAAPTIWYRAWVFSRAEIHDESRARRVAEATKNGIRHATKLRS